MWCFHDRLREFTFKSGAVIKMCPDCTTFDNKRREVLKTGHVEMVKSKQEIHWGVLLDKAGLSPFAGQESERSMTYVGDAHGVQKMQEHEAISMRVVDVFGTLDDLVLRRKPKYKPTDLDDSEWVNRQRPFGHSQAMPRRFNSYCTSCTDVVVDKSRNKVRVTKGVYLPIEHECAAVRVYNLSGELLEVKAI